MKEAQFYTAEEVAQMLTISVATVRRWAHTGTLPAFRFGRQLRVPQTEFQTWLESHRAAVGRPVEVPDLDAESRAWMETGLEAAAQGISAAERDVPPEELRSWLQTMTYAVTPLEAGHV